MAHARQRARCGDSMTSRQPIGAPRNAPSDATAERALLFAPAVRRCSVGPHAWSRARVDRLAPRKEPKPSGEASFCHCTARRRRPSHPQKLGCWGSGGCFRRTPILVHTSMSAFTPLPAHPRRHAPPRWTAELWGLTVPRGTGRPPRPSGH